MPTSTIGRTSAETTVAARKAGWSACARPTRSVPCSLCTVTPSRLTPRGSPWFTITPISVTPSVAPIERENCVIAVAAPIRARGTAFCTARTKTCIISPSPTPAMTMLRAASPFVVCSFIRQRKNIPTVRTIGPAIAFGRTRPLRDTHCPDRTDAVTAPSISGVSTTPDDVADVPITPCTNSGT
jgi:hypothetical protein